jgi:hypothetical protein
MFTIGNIKSNSLAEAIRRKQRNVLYWWIALEGPHEILKNIGCRGEIYHKCEACDAIWLNREKLRALASRKEEIFSELVERGKINARI